MATGGRVRWEIGEKVRAHIVGFSGVNFSGERWEVDIWPHGGRQGDEIDGRRVKSIGIIAPYGTRMILMAARSKAAWLDRPWRCIQVLEGSTFESRDRGPGVQIPDLDQMDAPGSLFADQDFVIEIPRVDRLEDGVGWTFGRPGPLKCALGAIRVERIPQDD